MGVVIPVGYGQATLRFGYPGHIGDMVCVWGFKNDSGSTVASTVASIIYNNWTMAGSPGQATQAYTDWAIGPVDVTLMTGTGPITGSGGAYTGGGRGAGAPPPMNCSVLLRKQTARGGRAGRGRAFQPSFNVAETAVDGNGFMSGADALAITSKYNFWQAEMIADDVPLVLLHSDVAMTPDFLTDIVCQTQVATQRKRMRR